MRWIALTLALVSVPGAALAAPASDFCARLKQVAASALQTPSFGSMVIGDGFGGGDGSWVPPSMRLCVASRFHIAGVGDQYDCVGNFGTEAAATAELAKLQADVGACLKAQGVAPQSAQSVGLGQLDYAAGAGVQVRTYRQSLRLGHRAGFTVKVVN